MALEGAFKGKKVLVTGAGRGIGRAVVKRLHSYGAVVYALSRNPKGLESLKEECPGIKVIACDIGNWDETRKLLTPLDPMDYLLNNAAVMEVKPIMKVTSAEFDHLFNVNVKGAMNVSQIVADKMISSGKGGSICFLSSIAGAKPHHAIGAYCMSKSAVDMLANSMALELGPQKIRVNVVRPAAVDTDMIHEINDGLGKTIGIDQGTVDALMEARTPYRPYPGYYMNIDGLINLILFTLSDLCPQMTGSASVMDGGYLLS